MDEAPLLIISNYEVTFFLRRNVRNVCDKRLEVSPPVSWNSLNPTPLAAWLYALHYAAELLADNSKSRLGRDLVPLTPTSGYQSEAGSYFLSRQGWYQRGPRRQPPRGQGCSGQGSSGGYNQQQQQKQLEEDHALGSFHRAVELQGCWEDAVGELDLSGKRASSGSGSGSVQGSISSSLPASSNSSRSSSHDGCPGPATHHWRSLMQAGPVDAVAALAVLPDSVLRYSDCALSASSTSVVVKVRQGSSSIRGWCFRIGQSAMP